MAYPGDVSRVPQAAAWAQALDRADLRLLGTYRGTAAHARSLAMALDHPAGAGRKPGTSRYVAGFFRPAAGRPPASARPQRAGCCAAASSCRPGAVCWCSRHPGTSGCRASSAARLSWPG